MSRHQVEKEDSADLWRRILMTGLTNQKNYDSGWRRVTVDGRIPEEIVEEVRLRTDIVELISGYVTLQRHGKNYVGLCPFHSEKTPSFTVNSEKQIFYCFGCHVGGNALTFLMKKENWTFVETVQRLAQRYGLALPERSLSPQEQEAQRRRRRWEEIHDWAAAYFNEILLKSPEGEPGRAYFQERGVSAATIESFRLGFAPDRWDGLLAALQARGVSPAELVQAGLALERETAGRYYDRFRNRVMFSILDSRGRVVAFGGRVLDDAMPKYLNSPETEFFNKGQHLYGMQRAHQGIRELGFALLVEGYMDVIALQQAGFPNAVASLGTALTREQARVLRRYTSKVVLSYDADNAGVQAAIRAGEILRDAGLRVEVLTLKGGKDPDEIIKAQGIEVFQQAISAACSYVEFKYKILSGANPLRGIEEKAELVRKLAPDIVKVASPVEREGYERFLSFELGLTLEAVQREIGSFAKEKPKRRQEQEQSPLLQDISVKNRDNIFRCADTAEASVRQGVYKAERLLLRLLSEDLTRLPRIIEKLGAEFWRLPVHRAIFAELTAGCPPASTRLAELQDEQVRSTWAGILAEEIDLSQSDKIYEDCIRTIRAATLEESVEDLQERMAQLEKAGDLAGAMVLLREIGERLRSGEK